ncbi:MAG: RNase adapter RapZ, partial [Oscillospiraceae bacterium]
MIFMPTEYGGTELKMQLIIVTGLSGSGKSHAINFLEDIGFYCVDNIPPRLLLTFADLCSKMNGTASKMAVVIDARGKEMFSEFFSALDELTENSYNLKILFLDCSTPEIINRYKQTRRRHPLLNDKCTSLDEAIELERNILNNAKQRADYVIDTSMLSVSQLKESMYSIFQTESKQKFIVSCVSFGFKYGIPADADLVFDVRCLPNPFYIPELKPHSGLNESVRDYVLSCPQSIGVWERLSSLIDYLIPLYSEEEKRSRLVIAVGCTGGRHRSVVFAEKLNKHFEEQGILSNVNHRDIDRIK